MEAFDLKSFYEQVEIVKSQFIQLNQIILELDHKLSMNPASTKYMQVLLKILPLTINVSGLKLSLGGNRLEESKMVDICFALKNFGKVTSLNISLKNNELSTSCIGMLSLSLSYLKKIRRLTLNFDDNSLSDGALEVLLNNLTKLKYLEELKISIRE